MAMTERPRTGWIEQPPSVVSVARKQTNKYSRNLDYLIAAIIYLGTQPLWWARTVPNLAMELTLEAQALREVFNSFPGIFRRSSKQNGSGEYYYSLQARYAKRSDFNTKETEVEIPPLTSEDLSLICGFVQKMAEGEIAERRARIGVLVAMIAAIVSAVAAISASMAKSLLGS